MLGFFEFWILQASQWVPFNDSLGSSACYLEGVGVCLATHKASAKLIGSISNSLETEKERGKPVVLMIIMRMTECSVSFLSLLLYSIIIIIIIVI